MFKWLWLSQLILGWKYKQAGKSRHLMRFLGSIFRRFEHSMSLINCPNSCNSLYCHVNKRNNMGSTRLVDNHCLHNWLWAIIKSVCVTCSMTWSNKLSVHPYELLTDQFSTRVNINLVQQTSIILTNKHSYCNYLTHQFCLHAWSYDLHHLQLMCIKPLAISF